MTKELLKLSKSLTKKADDIEDLFGFCCGDFLDDDIDSIWGLIGESYGIDLEDDAIEAIIKYSDGEMTLSKADKILKEIKKKQEIV